MSCSDYECGVALFDTSSGEMLHCEMFELLQEGRNKADYVVSPDGRWVSYDTRLDGAMKDPNAGRMLRLCIHHPPLCTRA